MPSSPPSLHPPWAVPFPRPLALSHFTSDGQETVCLAAESFQSRWALEPPPIFLPRSLNTKYTFPSSFPVPLSDGQHLLSTSPHHQKCLWYDRSEPNDAQEQAQEQGNLSSSVERMADMCGRGRIPQQPRQLFFLAQWIRPNFSSKRRVKAPSIRLPRTKIRPPRIRYKHASHHTHTGPLYPPPFQIAPF